MRPATLASLAGAPGLIDEYLIAMHPAVIGAGPQLFDGLSTDLALRLVEAKVFDGGCVVLRYEVVPPR
jgi:dihydrofolate reductase